MIEKDFEIVLEKLFKNDITITAREVIRNHPTLKHPSAITRSLPRQILLKQYQEKQRYLRKHLKSIKKQSQSKLLLQLAEKDKQIADLERKVQILTASHIAMIRAVGELGGMETWLKFFEKVTSIRNNLLDLKDK